MPQIDLAGAVRAVDRGGYDPGMNKNRNVVLLGGGGHACVVAEIARLAGWVPKGLLDDNMRPPASDEPMSVPRLGALSGERSLELLGEYWWLLALGGLAQRRELLDTIADHFPQAAQRAATVVHPSAWVSPASTIGAGVVIGAGAVVNPCAFVADHVIINTGAVVEHDVQVGTNAHIAPQAMLGGGARVGADALVGGGAVVLPGITVGPGATVGAGAVVTKPVGEGQTVVGTPARTL